MIAVDAPPQIGWRDRRTATIDPRRRRENVEERNPLRWHDCPMCWAQSRIWSEGAWRPCQTCMGTGQVMS